ncbi:hypothetical protein EMEDMD4_490075 [Sinorhizobium medicae]|uniref:Transmembrane protein n=1 Tax=Sinorhizobium medicae TaxID=110321 RepID=A0A508X022_9HYPH|nr:hypothetical protein EMEDMD4_490075 [Sinorhizobium medicae]
MLADVFLEVDMRSASSVLLIALMGRIDLGIALLAFLLGVLCRIRLLRVGGYGSGFSRSLVAAIFRRNWRRTATH